MRFKNYCVVIKIIFLFYKRPLPVMAYNFNSHLKVNNDAIYNRNKNSDTILSLKFIGYCFGQKSQS
jgi:hypothetical protein